MRSMTAVSQSVSAFLLAEALVGPRASGEVGYELLLAAPKKETATSRFWTRRRFRRMFA